jgi:DeoR/GlpR family transcriptional regulator of sugar metabolism
MRTLGAVTVAEVEELFGVSSMTARRDLAELERRGVARRTHGGAVLPAISAHEDSFARRLDVDAEEKARLAGVAVGMLTPHETIFLDSSTTTYYVARRLVEAQIAATVLTNSLPVMELLFREGGPSLEVIGIGGNLRRLTRSFVGPFAVRTVQGHFADRLFLSVKGIANGMLTDADPLEAELKRTMIEQASESVLLIDHSKLETRGLSVIAPISDLTVVVTGLDEPEADALRLGGITVLTA